jgi:ABC-2 type transport system ATP-binding protein
MELNLSAARKPTVGQEKIHRKGCTPGGDVDVVRDRITATDDRTHMSLLEISHLRKTFGDLVAVEDVSFSVDAGEVFGLLGPNGAGKSTTMMMLAGLLRPDSGTIRLNGEELDPDNREVRMMLGVVPQDLAIYPDLTARENLSFFGRLYGLRGRQLKERISISLDRTGLAGRADDLAGHFSGGMKRRLNFGVALLHQPRLLILDEPTVGVDPQSRAHLLDCIRELSQEGVAALYASHYMEEVQAICRRVGIIDRGRMLACGDLHELLSELSANLCLHVSKPAEGFAEKLDGLAELLPSNNGVATIVVPRKPEPDAQLNQTISKVLSLLENAHIELHSIESHEPNLERLFLKLTGNSLRD